MKDSQREAKRRYRQKCRKVYFEVCPPEDDILEKLDSLNMPVATYIKNLIRKDIKAGK